MASRVDQSARSVLLRISKTIPGALGQVRTFPAWVTANLELPEVGSSPSRNSVRSDVASPSKSEPAAWPRFPNHSISQASSMPSRSASSGTTEMPLAVASAREEALPETAAKPARTVVGRSMVRGLPSPLQVLPFDEIDAVNTFPLRWMRIHDGAAASVRSATVEPLGVTRRASSFLPSPRQPRNRWRAPAAVDSRSRIPDLAAVPFGSIVRSRRVTVPLPVSDWWTNESRSAVPARLSPPAMMTMRSLRTPASAGNRTSPMSLSVHPAGRGWARKKSSTSTTLVRLAAGMEAKTLAVVLDGPVVKSC